MQSPDSPELSKLSPKLGPYRLAPGIGPRNALTLFFVSFSTIGLVTWPTFANPYLFALLGVPPETQGELASILVLLQELVQILIGGFIGALSDRHGRRIVLTVGLLLMAVGYAVYPLAQDTTQLVALRAFYAVGMTAATVMMSASLADYSHNQTRGRWMGTAGVCNGLGTVVMATVLARLPEVLVSRGFSQADALVASFWIFAGYILLLAAVARLGLAPHRPMSQPRRSPLWRQTLAGLTIARDNPRIALAYLTAFASRGDLVILTTFMSLWVVQAGLAEGLTPAAATGKAGMVFGLAQSVALLWSLVMGFILDRIPRLTGVVVAFGLAALGYGALGLVPDPLGPGMLPAAVLAGIGEASAVVAAGTFIGQEAPAANRGVVLGTFGVSGALGMLVLTLGGGQVYDQIGGGAPFAMMGVVNLAVAVAALAVRQWALRAATGPAQP